MASNSVQIVDYQSHFLFFHEHIFPHILPRLLGISFTALLRLLLSGGKLPLLGGPWAGKHGFMAWLDLAEGSIYRVSFPGIFSRIQPFFRFPDKVGGAVFDR